METLVIMMRRSSDRHIFIIGILIRVRRHLYIETPPCSPSKSLTWLMRQLNAVSVTQSIDCWSIFYSPGYSFMWPFVKTYRADTSQLYAVWAIQVINLMLLSPKISIFNDYWHCKYIWKYYYDKYTYKYTKTWNRLTWAIMRYKYILYNPRNNSLPVIMKYVTYHSYDSSNLNLTKPLILTGVHLGAYRWVDHREEGPIK